MGSKENEKIDLIYDLIKENRQELGDFREEVREDHHATQQRLASIEQQDMIQNQQLAEHMRRTALLEEMHVKSTERIIKLEQPKIIYASLLKWAAGLTAIVGTIITIVKMIK